MSEGSLGMSGNLEARRLRPAAPHRARGLRIPGLGRVLFTRDTGDANLFSS